MKACDQRQCRNASWSEWRVAKHGRPTLKLLKIDSLDIAAGQVLYVGDQSIGILPGVVWEPRNEVLEVRICPGVAC
jgi:hypothetical protein